MLTVFAFDSVVAEMDFLSTSGFAVVFKVRQHRAILPLGKSPVEEYGQQFQAIKANRGNSKEVELVDGIQKTLFSIGGITINLWSPVIHIF